jgi:hypothetical protein
MRSRRSLIGRRADPIRMTRPRIDWKGRFREGFRMPARRERWPGKKAGARKPPFPLP